MVTLDSRYNAQIDLSIIPTFECNLKCSFCMYEGSPTNTQKLDKENFIRFIHTIDWTKIGSLGFYGGEPSINTQLYLWYILRIPATIPKFVISNGTWSQSIVKSFNFITWAEENGLKIYVSSNNEQKICQNKTILDLMQNEGLIIIKKSDETFYPMGRNFNPHFKCSHPKCKTDLKIHRIAIFPDSTIRYQSCNGIYPILGTTNNSMDEILMSIKTKIPCKYDNCDRKNLDVK